ncbi:MAG: ABC transporter substrate-binding protein, partial [Alphaproteobacteria bacterium]
MIVRTLAAALVAGLVAAAPAAAGEKLALVLNFVASGDHAPYYFARAQGWYQAAGIDLDIELGQGSGVAVQKVGVGKNAVGIADMGSVLVGRGKGADVVAAMAIYANSPFGMYWLKSSGITGPKDFAGKRLGAPPGDAGRVMWPAFARKAGIDAASVTMVNVAPLAKLQMLKSGGIDFTQSFYSGHAFFAKALGQDMGYLAWKDVGINP